MNEQYMPELKETVLRLYLAEGRIKKSLIKNICSKTTHMPKVSGMWVVLYAILISQY